MAEVLHVSVRETRGKRNARRMRRSGSVPAILYGHGKESVSLSVPQGEVDLIVRHNLKLVELEGEVTDTALIREIQWDTFGLDVLHLDLTRVDPDEMVETTVAVQLRGEAPGSKVGGRVELLAHEIQIKCPVVAIPERLQLNINSLELGESLTAAALPLPEGAELVGDSEAVLVHCVEVTAVEEEAEEEAPGAAEPEVIGRKAEEEEESAT